MITLCSVIVDKIKDYLDVLLYSIIKYDLSLINEIIVCKSDDFTGKILDFYKIKNIPVKVIGNTLPSITNYSLPFFNDICGHALGLHTAIDKAKNDYILIVDPDVYFKSKIDEFFLNLHQKHELFIVGASHYNPNEQCYAYFPTIICCLVNQNKLPPNTWLNNKIYWKDCMNLFKEKCHDLAKMDGKYLIPGPILEYYQLFPNPREWFDVGCNLWLWSHQNHYKWLSFQENNDYNSKYFKSNFNLLSLPEQPLLFHLKNSVRSKNNKFITDNRENIENLRQIKQPLNQLKFI